MDQPTLERILGRGYFPEVLPPVFDTTEFGSVLSDEGGRCFSPSTRFKDRTLKRAFLKRLTAMALRIAFAIIFLILPQWAAAQTEFDAQAINSLLNKSESTVFMVEAGKRKGSCVLVGTEKIQGQLYGYFATCFHVLYQADALDIYDTNEKEIASQLAVFPKPELDLVLIKAKLAIGREYDSVNLNTGIKAKDETKEEFLAIGFPYYRRTVLHEAKLRLAPSAESRNFDVSVFRSRQFQIRPVLGEPTSRGMSGGPILNRSGQFAGLLLGRVRDTVGFVLPPDEIAKALDDSKKASANFKPFDSSIFQVWEPLPYRKTVVEFFQAFESELDDSIAWSINSNWQDIFDGNSIFRERFQEISVDLDRLSQSTERLSLRIDQASFRPGANDKVRVLINGKEYECSEPVDIPIHMHLQPGENLILVSKRLKKDSAPNELKVNELLNSSTLQYRFMKGDEQLYSIRRELPVLFGGFTTYVTVPRVKLDNSAKFNAIVAFNLNHLAKYATKNPFEMAGNVALPELGDGLDLKINQSSFQIEGQSMQSARVRFESKVESGAFRLRYAGIQLKQGHPQNSAINVEGILQLVRFEDQFRLVGRFISADIDSFDIKLSNELSIDLANPVAELMLVAANNGLDDTVLDARRVTPIESSETISIADRLLPGILSANEEVKVTSAKFQKDGWLQLALWIGEDTSKAATEVPDIVGKKPIPDTVGIWQSFAVPRTTVEGVLARTMKKPSPTLVASASVLAQDATIFWICPLPLSLIHI